MRSSLAICLIALVPAVLAAPGCRNAPEAASAEAFESARSGASAFSAERAWAHLEALAAIGPRAVGTPGAEQARSYITNELTRLGLEVDVWSARVTFEGADAPEPIEIANLAVTLPGESSDWIVLAAPYDSAYQATFEYIGVNDGASGAAVLLEVARVLAEARLPYTVELLFLGGDAPLGRGSPEDLETRHVASVAAAGHVAAEGDLARVRLLLYLNRVSDADLRIPRDRFSHRPYRDAIWRTAAELGHGDVFTLESDFEAPAAGHRAFNDQGMRRTVAIVDPHLGSDELPDAGEFTEDDTLQRSSAASLAVVGDVVLAGLDAIGAWLQKIDRFSDAPPPPAPKPEPAAADPAEPEPAADTAPSAASGSEPATGAAASAPEAGSTPAADTAPAPPAAKPPPEAAPAGESAPGEPDLAPEVTP